jgi:SAM-dependent methyltransferase
MVSKLLSNQFFWNLVQFVLGANKEKMRLYRQTFSETGSLLDFGCANGNTYPAFSDFNYHGLDLDPVAISAAKKSYPNVSFTCNNIFNQPFPNHSFDYVLFGCTGHHLPTPIFKKIILRLTDFLKNNGEIHFIDMVRSRNDSPLLKFILNHDQGKHVRTQYEYHQIFKSISSEINVENEIIKPIKTFLVPKPLFYSCIITKSQ